MENPKIIEKPEIIEIIEIIEKKQKTTFSLSVCLVSPPVFLSICLSVYLSVCFSVCLSVCLAVCLSVWLPVLPFQCIRKNTGYCYLTVRLNKKHQNHVREHGFGVWGCRGGQTPQPGRGQAPEPARRQVPPKQKLGGACPRSRTWGGGFVFGGGAKPQNLPDERFPEKKRGVRAPPFFCRKKKEGCAHPLLFFCRKKRGVRAPFFFVQKKEGCAHFFSSFLMKNILKKTRGARTPFFFLSSFLMKNIGKKTRGARPPFFPLVFDEKQKKK